MKAREKRFCVSFATLGSAVEAAKNAGYKGDFERIGNELLCRQEIADYISELIERKEKSLAKVSDTGYRRLAFGNISDAVSLLYMENPSIEELSNMDLFMVSEIKHPKNGSMEIKFFDRLKALEKLENGGSEKNSAASLFDAINESARRTESDRVEN